MEYRAAQQPQNSSCMAPIILDKHTQTSEALKSPFQYPNGLLIHSRATARWVLKSAFSRMFVAGALYAATKIMEHALPLSETEYFPSSKYCCCFWWMAELVKLDYHALNQYIRTRRIKSFFYHSRQPSQRDHSFFPAKIILAIFWRARFEYSTR